MPWKIIWWISQWDTGKHRRLPDRKSLPAHGQTSSTTDFPMVRGMSRGRPPYGLETMLRIHLMQNGWSLRDDAMEDVLIDTGTIRRFAGIDLAKDNILDATTILAFRHVVEQHHLT